MMAITPTTPTIIIVRGVPSSGDATGAGGTVCVSLGVIGTGEGDTVTGAPTIANVVETGVSEVIFVPPFWYAIAKYEKPVVNAR